MPGPLEELLTDTGWLRDLARRLVRDAAQADDLVQETLLAAWLRPPARADHLRGWLAVVLRNAARQVARRERSRTRRETAAVAESGAIVSTERLVEKIDTGRLVARLATELAEPYRTAVLLRYYEGMRAAQIARRLGVPEGTVRWRIHEGLQALRVRLDAHFGDDRGAWCALLLPLAGEHAWLGILGFGALLKGLLAMKVVQSMVVLAIAGMLWWGLSGEGPSDVPHGAIAARSRSPAGPADDSARVAGVPERSDASPTPAARAAVEDQGGHASRREAAVELRVIDVAGRPIEGADVTLLEVDVVHTRSGADGRARLAGEVPDEFVGQLDRPATFRVSLLGFADEAVPARVVPGEVVDLGDVILHPAGRIVGRVTDAEGAPLAGVRVTLADLAERLAQTPGGVRNRRVGRESDPSTLTDATGRYALEAIRPGSVNVSARLDGYQGPVRSGVEVRAGETCAGVDLVLHPRPEGPDRPLRCEGVVLDGEGRPVPAARIGIDYLRSGGGSGSSTVIADRDGRFHWNADGLRVRLIRALDVRWQWRPVERIDPDLTAPLELRLGAPLRVRVTATDPAGHPVTGPQVACRDVGATPEVVTWSDASPGAWTDVMVPLHPFTVRIVAEGFAEWESQALDPDRLPASVAAVLRPIAGIRGRVTRAGEPVAGALVEVRQIARRNVVIDGYPAWQEPGSAARATSGADGGFALTVREPMRAVLAVSGDGFALTEVGPFDFDPRIGMREQVVEVAMGGVIEGRVRMPPRRGATGQIVAASRGDGHVRTQRVDGAGRYRFDGLTPGPWWIGPSDQLLHARAGTSWSAGVGPAYVHTGNCEVRDGQVTTFDLDLTRCRVSGRCQISLHPLAGATLRLESRGVLFGFGAERFETILAIDGSFHLDAGAAGHYQLTVTAADGLLLHQEVELKLGSQEWTWIAEGAPLEVGQATDGMFVRFRRDGVVGLLPLRPDAAGVARVERVPIGEVEIVRFADAGSMGDPLAAEKIAAGRVVFGEIHRIDLPH